MTSLRGEDATSSGEDNLVGDRTGGAEIRRNTDVLDDGAQGGELVRSAVRATGEGEHMDAIHWVRENVQFVLAGRDKLVGGGAGHGSEDRLNNFDVVGFVVGDLLKASTDVRREAVVGEILGFELHEGIAVERVLEVFEGEGEVEDLGI